MRIAPRPLLALVQLIPPLVLLKTPVLVPAYTVAGVCVSTASAKTFAPFKPVLVELQEIPLSALLKTPTFVPAYKTGVVDESKASAKTLGPPRPVGAQV